MTEGPTALERRLNYVFRDPSLLKQALTHPSSGVLPDNQRMEFLGDSIFGAALSLLLFREKSSWPEGPLTKLRHLLVSTDSLHSWAVDLDLKLLLPGKSDPSHLKTVFRKPLADGVEAVLAAVFLDAQKAGEDGFATVSTLVEERFLRTVREAQSDAWERHDTKTTLQERAAELRLPSPIYSLLRRTGPDHGPTFHVQVEVGPHQAVASARSLKAAQAEAARELLALLTR